MFLRCYNFLNQSNYREYYLFMSLRIKLVLKMAHLRTSSYMYCLAGYLGIKHICQLEAHFNSNCSMRSYCDCAMLDWHLFKSDACKSCIINQFILPQLKRRRICYHYGFACDL